MPNIKNNYFKWIKRQVDQWHIEKLPPTKVRLYKIMLRVYIILSTYWLQWWFSFSYIQYFCSVYNYKKSSIHKKWLLIIFTTYLYVFPYMRNSVQVPRGFSGVFIIKLLLYLQNRLFNIQRERLLCLSTKSSYKEGAPYCSMILKP